MLPTAAPSPPLQPQDTTQGTTTAAAPPSLPVVPHPSTSGRMCTPRPLQRPKLITPSKISSLLFSPSSDESDGGNLTDDSYVESASDDDVLHRGEGWASDEEEDDEVDEQEDVKYVKNM